MTTTEAFPITLKELELFRFNFPQHGPLIDRCIREGNITVTDQDIFEVREKPGKVTVIGQGAALKKLAGRSA